MTDIVDVVVSLQARGYEGDPVSGHRAQGVLVAPDLVLVPALPRDAARDGEEFDVLFAGPARDPERIPAAYTVAHGVRGDGDLTAFVRLVRPASYPVFKPPDRPSPQALRLAVPEDQVSAALGKVPPTPPAEPLVGLHLVLHQTLSAAGGGICDYVPWCAAPPDRSASTDRG
jgi:hypothetical protein